MTKEKPFSNYIFNKGAEDIIYLNWGHVKSIVPEYQDLMQRLDEHNIPFKLMLQPVKSGRVNFTGISQTDFKLDPADGFPKEGPQVSNAALGRMGLQHSQAAGIVIHGAENQRKFRQLGGITLLLTTKDRNPTNNAFLRHYTFEMSPEKDKIETTIDDAKKSANLIDLLDTAGIKYTTHKTTFTITDPTSICAVALGGGKFQGADQYVEDNWIHSRQTETRVRAR